MKEFTEQNEDQSISKGEKKRPVFEALSTWIVKRFEVDELKDILIEKKPAVRAGLYTRFRK